MSVTPALRARWSRLPFRPRLAIVLALIAGGWLGLAALLHQPALAWAAVGVVTAGSVVGMAAAACVSAAVQRGSTRLRAMADGNWDGTAVAAADPETAPLDDALARLEEAVRSREAAMQSALLQMQEVERLKTDFVSTVSHELRTPLTSMRGALGLVLSGTTGELPVKARDLLRIAQSNTERLIRLINEMLDIEKIEAGHAPLRREWCELGALAQQTLRGLETLAADGGVRLQLEAPKDVFVSGDADRLVQVLTNLVSNAVKFSPRGGAVTVSIEAEGRSARVHVTDEGPGIPAEFRPRIFGKFQQADTGDTRRATGTGLGLAIARAIVEMHEGTIGFETADGRGTTFTVELPWSPPTAAPATSDGYRILLLDHDLGMLSVLGTLCASLGETFGVRTAGEAWEATRGTRFDALIVDPVADGTLEFVRRLRRQANYGDLPVLVFSSVEYGHAALEGVALSAQHVFVKARDRESDVVMRLRAMLAVRRPRLAA